MAKYTQEYNGHIFTEGDLVALDYDCSGAIKGGVYELRYNGDHLIVYKEGTSACCSCIDNFIPYRKTNTTVAQLIKILK